MPATAHDPIREHAVRAAIAAHVPEAAFWLPARDESVPVARQALRAFGGSLGLEDDTLEDAEIAVTEAVANAVEHAYDEGDGEIELTFSASVESLAVTVRDRGRGLYVDEDSGGFGISIIESISRAAEFTDGDGGEGTEVVMFFEVSADGARAAVASDRLEAVVRRTVAVVAAQLDVRVRSLSALLDVIGRAARAVPDHLVDAAAIVAVDRVDHGLELRVGPLDGPGGRDLATLASTRLDEKPLGAEVKLLPARNAESRGLDLVILLSAAGS